MKPNDPNHHSIRTALRLALPTEDPAGWVQKLARTPPLVRRRPTRLQVDEVFHDTPDRRLHQQRITWRTLRNDLGGQVLWQQILEVEKPGFGALSHCEAWASPLSTVAPERNALPPSFPSFRIDVDGMTLQALTPCCATSTERTRWTIRRRDGTHIEVTLKIGHLTAGDQRIPVCELELELLAGLPVVLFELAMQIARTLALFPSPMTQHDQGHALDQGSRDTPWTAQPPSLKKSTPLRRAAGVLLTEMLGHFTANLVLLQRSDDPEVVHQARVGWRRFKSGVRLFKTVLPSDSAPSWKPLASLLRSLGELRDCDVALTETLPGLQHLFTEGEADRQAHWASMLQAMEQAAHQHRGAVRLALQTPEVGQALLSTLEWLTDLSTVTAWPPLANIPQRPLQDWARRRLDHLRRRLKTATHDLDHLESQHSARILAKRLRYSAEALQGFLPKQRGRRWAQEGTRWQAALGASRDIARASTLAGEVGADPRLVEFLRGVAVGQQTRDTTSKNRKH